jgi:hypothetical protein
LVRDVAQAGTEIRFFAGDHGGRGSVWWQEVK